MPVTAGHDKHVAAPAEQSPACMAPVGTVVAGGVVVAESVVVGEVVVEANTDQTPLWQRPVKMTDSAAKVMEKLLTDSTIPTHAGIEMPTETLLF